MRGGGVSEDRPKGDAWRWVDGVFGGGPVMRGRQAEKKAGRVEEGDALVLSC